METISNHSIDGGSLSASPRSASNREVNILLLCETGVGKSTWINGFANILAHTALEEVDPADEAIFPIPSAFTIVNENYQTVPISTGTDVCEKHGEGQSATQRPRTYVFPAVDGTIRIIDTPGIGDTRGIEQDLENFQQILNHIANLDRLHGICILLKPDRARLDLMFEYCIKGLFANLHKNACRNIVFCFTNCRGTSYMPGETMMPLRRTLDDNGVDVALNKETIYCIDNEFVRYLAGRKVGYSFKEFQRKNFQVSWRVAAKELKRLLKHFSAVEPHLVKHTLSINDARRLIMEAAKPLAEITRIVQKTIGAIQKLKRDLVGKEADKRALANDLYIPHFRQKTIPFECPLVVCTSKKCRPIVGEPCARNVQSKCARESDKRFVQEAFPNVKVKCRSCGCDEKEHEIVLFEVQAMEVNQHNPIVLRQLENNETISKVILAHIEKLEERNEELDEEQKLITQTMVKFTLFLKTNAIAPYNGAMDRYLRFTIRNSSNDEAVERLEEIRRRYQRETESVEEMRERACDDASPTTSEIGDLIAGLYSLKNVGQMIRECVMVAEDTEINAAKSKEVVVTLKKHAHVILSDPQTQTP